MAPGGKEETQMTDLEPQIGFKSEKDSELNSEEHDQVIEAIGPIGKWQKYGCFSSSFARLFLQIPGAFPVLSITFVAAASNHWCQPLDDIHGMTSLEWAQSKSPSLENGNLDTCHIYETNSNESIHDCTAWDYDRDNSNETIVSEFNLVCDRVWLLHLTKSIYFFGLMIGVIVSGWAADYFGRKPVLQILFIGMTVFGIASAFMNSVEWFIVMRFFQGMFTIGVSVTIFCWLMEIVKGKWQTFVGIAFSLPWVIGWFWLALIAYIWPNWRKIQMITSFLTLPPVILLYWLPESPKWLLAVGKLDKAETIIRKAAKVNETTLPQDWKLKPVRKDAGKNQKGNILDLFRSKNLALKTLIMYINWFANSFVYYGLTLNTSSLTGSTMTDFLLNGALEIPSYMFCTWILLHKGRKLTYVGMMLAGGIALLGTLAIPEPASGETEISYTRIVLALIGKFCITGTFAIVYIYSAEVFPTTVRGVGMGSSSVWARVGGMVAPYVGALATSHGRALPTAIFGATAGLAGLTALFLPETAWRKLPDTVEECIKVPLGWRDGIVEKGEQNNGTDV